VLMTPAVRWSSGHSLDEADVHKTDAITFHCSEFFLDQRHVITSSSNPLLKEAIQLRSASMRLRTGCTLVDGRREIRAAIAANVEILEVFVDASDESADTHALLEVLASRGSRMVMLATRVFTKLAFGARNEGVVALVRWKAGGLAELPSVFTAPIFVIEAVEKPGNLGAIFRSADATGIAAVVVADGRTDPANPAVIRSSLGTVFSVPLAVASTQNTIDWCFATNRRIVAASPEGAVEWHTVDLTGSVAILFGNESFGISNLWKESSALNRLSWQEVRLPMCGLANSLNVSASAAVFAYESLRQRVSKP